MDEALLPTEDTVAEGRAHTTVPRAARRVATSRPATFSRRRRGQALVEFALVLPVMAMILLGAIDFGRIMFSYIQITNAAREGVAYAMGQPTDYAGIQQRVLQETDAQSQRGENTVQVTVTCIDSASGSVVPCTNAPSTGLGSEVEVAVSEPFTFFSPLISSFFPNFTMTAASTAFTLSPVTGAATTAPSASPSPTATPTPAPTGTATPTATPAPTPTPALCPVPNFVGQHASAASGLWTGAGFTAGNLTNNVNGNSKISQQSLGSGTSQPCATATITLN